MEQLRVGIVGSGLMGREIATYLAEHGYPVLLKGRKQSDIDQFLDTIRKMLLKQLRWGKISHSEFESRMASINGTVQFDHRFSEVDIIVESVLEDLDVKRQVFQQIEATCSDDTILCTNTSTLSVGEIAHVLRDKRRFLGTHFFQPAIYFKFIEIVPTVETSNSALQSACSLARGIGKKTLMVADSPGVFFNRIMIAGYLEVYRALESGEYGIDQIDTMFKKSNFLLGPLHSTDMTGVDILLHSALNLNRVMPQRFDVPVILQKMVEIGRLGKKSGKGFYNYESDPEIDREILAILEEFKIKRSSHIPALFSLEQCLLRIMNEAVYCVQEGIVDLEDAESILRSVPPFAFTHGLFTYMDDVGIDVIVDKLLALQRAVGERFTPAPMLVELQHKGLTGAKKGRGFFKHV
jgi:3-hydroxyacyl-CoA dehydrogenase/enoyl-CoA hydratase/3-hydroxybutyryl-CoA epimerase